MRLALLCSIILMFSGRAMAQDSPIRFENAHAAYEISSDGANLHFVDKATGVDYAAVEPRAAFARVKKAGQVYPASAVTRNDDRLSVAFGESCITSELLVKTYDSYWTFEVVSVAGDGVEELTILDVPLTLKGALDEPFSACALALNLKTNVPEVPGPNRQLHAYCYPRFGIEGAKVAIIGCPMAQLRDVMKAVVSAADEIPKSNIGGPWALDAPSNRGSYLFDFSALTEQTVDDWIALVKQLGLNQIDFHTGTSLRFGDCAPNPTLFPNGRASVKAVLDKLHAAGIAAGLHTYAFFIAKNAPYVTPVPDPRLGKDATFTLAGGLAVDANAVPVVETTEKMSTITGFFVHNSVTLQIDDELITYSGVAKEPPYAFTGCTRGAYGTTAAAHADGAKVYHLKECFGLFTPDADSTLLAEVAANTADTFNECGFDMIYLDALDGEAILGGAENAWHYGSKFVFEIANRLERPALFEMSTFHHHLWYVRARMGAWDHPSRSHKRFIDVHCAANTAGSGMFLPMTLGWWAVKTWNDGPEGTQLEPTFPDDIEYLMCKGLGNGFGIALMGVNPGNIGQIPAYQRLAPIFRQYEELRHANYFPESIKARLRVPGDEFTLEQTVDGKWRFVPVQYDKHKVQGIDSWSNVWTASNPHGAQPVQFRIEALMTAAPYDAPEGVTVEDFANAANLSERASAEGVQAALASSTDQMQAGTVSGAYTATSNRGDPNGSWTKAERVFDPPLNIAKQQALGVWVHGDGRGELLNVQLRSPEHTTSLGIGDHYMNIDFTGWRYFELIEPEGGRIEEHTWPYGGSYAVYRECVDYAQVKRLSLWYNNLPANQEVT
ncbi:MAG: hypothetical protein QG656_2401, partial [Candidatus Hydrogenedentes bacterium]|nr:hypothetical protein [Candidatus Hydrogenedentota bacterium]